MQNVILDKQESKIIYVPKWIDKKNADHYFEMLLKKINWQEEEIQMFGKKVKVPRLIAWYGDKEAKYKYSGVVHIPLPWLKELLSLKKKISLEFNLDFNSVLANLYRSGNDYIGWHSDDEKALGSNPIIASVSFGAKRKILFKSKKTHEQIQIYLEHGSLLIMEGKIQQLWQHSLPKMRKIADQRINLTFRKILY